MTLGELKQRIDKTVLNDPLSLNSDVRVEVEGPTAIGPTPSIGVTGANLGFDWDTNKFLISTEVKVIDPRREILRQRKTKQTKI